jgi:hypothetical protein
MTSPPDDQGAGDGGGADGSDDVHVPEEGSAEDRFYQGVISRIQWGREMGTVLSRNGREIEFDFRFVTMIGDYPRVESLRTGMRVGFDVGWTSSGLRVTTLKIYE